MIRWKEMMGKVLHAVEVVTFDYPYYKYSLWGLPEAERSKVIHEVHLRSANKLQELCFANGGIYIKLGQHIGQLEYVVPVEYVQTMRESMLNRCPVSSYDQVCEVVKKAISNHPGHPLILAGKSTGSRASCPVAGREDVNASAVVCLGYPLKGMKGAIRDEILVQLTVPIMFVQGSKDGLCPLDKLKSVQKKIKPLNEMYVVEGGDHSLKVAKKHLLAEGSTQEDAEGSALEAIAKFVAMGHVVSSPSCEESKKKNMRDIGKGAMDLGELLMACEMEEAEIQRSVPFTYQFNGQYPHKATLLACPKLTDQSHSVI